MLTYLFKNINYMYYSPVQSLVDRVANTQLVIVFINHIFVSIKFSNLCMMVKLTK